MIKVTVGTGMNRKTMIVESDRTPKSIMEEAGIDYSISGIQLDGSALNSREINASLEDLGVGETCFLISVIKADSGLKITKAGDSITWFSAIRAADLEVLAKLAPEALELKDKNDEVFFKVGLGNGGVSKFGVEFSSIDPETGLVYLTQPAGPTPTDPKEISEAFLAQMTNVVAIEEQIEEALKTVSGKVDEAAKMVTIVR